MRPGARTLAGRPKHPHAHAQPSPRPYCAPERCGPHSAPQALASLNVWMSNIDLGAEIFGPLLAGSLLDGTGPAAGFVIIGM
eukprot:3010480-Prymnesium_polylepis.1